MAYVFFGVYNKIDSIFRRISVDKQSIKYYTYCMINKDTILKILQQYNHQYKKSGFEFVSLFGSYARGAEDLFSDIDITYKIDHDRFFKDDGFAKLEKMEEIKKELESKFHKKIDMIPFNTKNKLLQKSLQSEQILL
jgi:predicted nucleotidyltransferase